MALLEPPVETSSKTRHLKFIAGALAILAAAALYFTFRFYPEQRVVQRFFDALVAGDTKKAYELWKPQPSYRMQDFLVAVSPYAPMADASDAEKSRKTRVVTIWMNTEDKSFSFPP